MIHKENRRIAGPAPWPSLPEAFAVEGHVVVRVRPEPRVCVKQESRVADVEAGAAFVFALVEKRRQVTALHSSVTVQHAV